MDLPQRLSRYWKKKEKQERKRFYVISLIVLLFLIHYLAFCIPQPFILKMPASPLLLLAMRPMEMVLLDNPGGERVEGFSNPLWTFLLSGLYLIGIEPFTSSKLMGAIFGSLALCSVYGVARRMRLGEFWSFVPSVMLAFFHPICCVECLRT